MDRQPVAMVRLVLHRLHGFDDLFSVRQMTKRTWTIRVAGYAPFQMVLLDGALNYEGALTAARVIWPGAQVE